MTIKKFAFEVQSSLSKAHGIELKRSHVHEVLAALFGFASYTALTTQRVLAQHDDPGTAIPLDVAGAAARALDLGYTPPMPPIIATVTAGAAVAERLCVVTIADVLATLGIESSSDEPDAPADDASGEYDSEADDEWEPRDEERLPWIDLDSDILRESLLRLAGAQSASAHLALAQLDEEFLEDDFASVNDGVYWFEQQQAGRLLTGVELEWAQTYRRKQEALLSREDHLGRAAALGNVEAALRQAEKEPSDEAFELAGRLAGARHAARLGRLAMSCGREDDALKWFRVAAQQGDTNAMKTLASELETDLKDAWTWAYLAELLGTNVMAYHAVGDDGLPADADEAGPIYAVGGFELDGLSKADDEAATLRARELFSAIADRGVVR
ncbi:hypothetical protein [Roseateles terrae]|uniref:Sel1 repeat family protein n=1 Tax=Roseateles terrae TaxID=431060 RepID=A0ABR6H042_9BURK|nr:hypothetical protein [Roseateles terrae]MBB3197371.1 hypothetical protein [Roseateles terrae]